MVHKCELSLGACFIYIYYVEWNMVYGLNTEGHLGRIKTNLQPRDVPIVKNALKPRWDNSNGPKSASTEMS
jgi:hypothetical protein